MARDTSNEICVTKTICNFRCEYCDGLQFMVSLGEVTHHMGAPSEDTLQKDELVLRFECMGCLELHIFPIVPRSLRRATGASEVLPC